MHIQADGCAEARRRNGDGQEKGSRGEERRNECTTEKTEAQRISAMERGEEKTARAENAKNAQPEHRSKEERRRNGHRQHNEARMRKQKSATRTRQRRGDQQKGKGAEKEARAKNAKNAQPGHGCIEAGRREENGENDAAVRENAKK